MQITIEHRFTSLNDYISAERTNRHIAAKIKREETDLVQMYASGSRQIKAYPVEITFQWFRKDQRTDPDNIAFAQKFVLDGLVKAGVLKSDGWKYISSIKHEFTLCNVEYVIVDIQ